MTIIVPVFNSERYLRECIASIQEQSYRNLEILCVDDGSADASAAILNDLARDDHRIRVISKTNGGVSSARNAGLDEATGEFVLFVDSDDWITPHMVNLTVAATDIRTDLVLPGAASGSCADCNGRRTLLYTVLRDETLNSPCAKLYRRSVLEENGIRFSDGITLGEDLLFNVRFVTAANTIVVVRERHYRVRIVEGSLSRSYQPNKYNDLEFVHNQIRELLHPFANEELNSLLNYLRIKMLLSCSKTYFSRASPMTTREARSAVRSIDQQNGKLLVRQGDLQMRAVAMAYNAFGLNALSRILRASPAVKLLGSLKFSV